MGIGGKIATTGGLIIGSILLLAYVGQKTNILSRFTSGLGSIGTAIGSGIGRGVVAIPQAFGLEVAKGITGQGQDPLGWKKAYQDFLAGLGLTDPFAGINTVDPQNPNDVNTSPYVPALSDPSIVTAYTREYTNSVQKALVSRAKSLGINVANVGRISKVSVSGSGKASVSRKVSTSAPRGSAVSASRSKSSAAARASARKSGKCFNFELDMGGVKQIVYRQFGVVPMHG